MNFERIPRGLENLYPVGIFSQRASKRPNKIGNSICELVDVNNKIIIVKGLDALNNSPVIDIKNRFILVFYLKSLESKNLNGLE